MSLRPPREHRGPNHELPDKRSLAIHVGVPHVGPDGHTRQISFPDAAVRSRWKLETLREEHRQLHEPEVRR